jgi:hypothetical protein
MASTALAGGGCGSAITADAGEPAQTVASDESQQTVSPSGPTKDEKS